MNKQVPSLGKLLVMVGFALSCFGLLLFLWLAFGGPTPLKPKGYRFDVSFGEATQLAHEADVRISGVPVGKVKDDRRPTSRPAAPTRRSSSSPSTRRCPTDAKAILRQKTLLGETYVELTPGSPKRPARSPTTDASPTGQVADTVELDEILRAFDPPDARGVPELDPDPGRQSLDGRGQDLNDALGNLAPFAEDTTKLLEILNAPEGRRAPARAQHRRGLRRAVASATASSRALITNSNQRLRDDRGARRRAAGDLQGAADVREGVPDDAQAAVAVLGQRQPARHRAAPGGQAAQPDAGGALGARARPQGALPVDSTRSSTASKKGLPATEEFLDQLHPLLANFDGPLQAAQPDPRRRRPVQERAHRVLRQHDGGDAGHGGVARHRRARALPAHVQPAEPRDARAVSEAADDQPHQPVPVPGRRR